MNTLVEITGAEVDLEPWFRRVEAVLTRFDPTSPLSQLNRAGGSWVLVPPLLYRAVAAALEAARETGGAYDPTVLEALEAAGYSRSFELGPQAQGLARPAGRSPWNPGWGPSNCPPASDWTWAASARAWP